jgi:hypothetical protein
MNELYSAAYVTIVAASGVDVWAGLPGVQPGSRVVKQLGAKVGGMTLVTAQPGFDEAMEGIKWNTRAWTFQERVLSNKLLIFTADSVFFSCRTLTHWEDTIIHPLKVLHHTRGFEEMQEETNLIHLGLGATGIQSFEQYADLVSAYMKRSLTYEADALNAFSGITHVSHARGGLDFFWGLPLRFFERALDFAIFVPLSYPGNRDHPKRRRAGFPSWSWTGWEWKSEAEIDKDSSKPPMEISYESTRYWPYDAMTVYYRVATTNGEPSHLAVFEGVCTEEAEQLYANAPKILPLDHTLRCLTLSLSSQVIVFESLVAFLPVLEDKVETPPVFSQWSARRARENSPVSRFGIQMPGVESSDREGRTRVDFDEVPIYLDRAWRNTQPEKLEFVVVAGLPHQSKGPFSSNRDSYLVFLVETDDQGISHRIESKMLHKAPFLAATPMRKRVYLA